MRNTLAELRESIFTKRFEINKRYAMSLKSEHLLQNYRMEAGIFGMIIRTDENAIPDIHWGWESPDCQLRGHFTGHWLSAAARIYRQTGDEELRAKADKIVSGLGICQQENGGEWAGSIPEKYMDRLAAGKRVWAPQYTLHKTFMGLVDMFRFAGNSEALEIADKWADWFHRWSGKFTREQMDDILDVETGGMLEVWADLYGITGKAKYKDLLERYDRPRLFDKLLRGEEAVSGMHANTTIPEIHGAARAYEVTGAERYRRIVEAYWKQVVEDLGYFCTGGQTTAEVWTKRQEQSTMLSKSNQEHCVVYNMIRLADFLFRWTGNLEYHDYIERNIYNGILAQQNPETGMVIYYLPLHTDAVKKWGTPTADFWCCHGTLLQAHTLYADLAFYENGEQVILSQYIPSAIKLERSGIGVEILQDFDGTKPAWKKPDGSKVAIEINAEEPVEFSFTFRVPWWAKGEFSIQLNGQEYKAEGFENRGFVTINRKWHRDKLDIAFPKKVTVCPMPDMPHMTAFMYGPAALAGLCREERTLYTEGRPAESLLRPYNTNDWEDVSFYTSGQPVNFKLVPLYNVVNERYTVYFPVK